ncbi:adenosine deaminase domain-containing 2 [Pelobates cultripes]|uniref:Adenosine deaminase domain-containing 2 n=1 Tax=Pelobates cultripes TaxID=61616 RepID=A0AAD1SXJ1_PELCU|nr:adenosine deaminase domain-containing 2 [Pelobates cultripes]
MSFTHGQRCAALASETFTRLIDAKYSSQKEYLAAFILEKEVMNAKGEMYEVVALGTGATCFQRRQEYHGLILHDSHALVVARRALIRYLYKQLYLYHSKPLMAQEKSIFCSSGKSPLLTLKPRMFLHLYLSNSSEGYSPGCL